MTEAAEQFTPIDRPLMRSDLNDIKVIVQDISDRQLEFLASVSAFERRLRATDGRVAALERTRWAPVFAGTIILVLTLAARLL